MQQSKLFVLRVRLADSGCINGFKTIQVQRRVKILKNKFV